MEVLDLGTEVTIDRDIPATIRGIAIYTHTHVKYLCVWWDERARKEEWLTIEEIKSRSDAKLPITFKR